MILSGIKKGNMQKKPNNPQNARLPRFFALGLSIPILAPLSQSARVLNAF